MSKTNIKATIDANVKRNGNQAITGQILNAVLNGMVDSLADQDETADKFNDHGVKLSELEEQINGRELEINVLEKTRYTTSGKTTGDSRFASTNVLPAAHYQIPALENNFQYQVFTYVSDTQCVQLYPFSTSVKDFDATQNIVVTYRKYVDGSPIAMTEDDIAYLNTHKPTTSWTSIGLTDRVSDCEKDILVIQNELHPIYIPTQFCDRIDKDYLVEMYFPNITSEWKLIGFSVKEDYVRLNLKKPDGTNVIFGYGDINDGHKLGLSLSDKVIEWVDGSDVVGYFVVHFANDGFVFSSSGGAAIHADRIADVNNSPRIKEYLSRQENIVLLGDSIFGYKPQNILKFFLKSNTGKKVFNSGFSGCRASLRSGRAGDESWNALSLVGVIDSIVSNDFSMMENAIANLSTSFTYFNERLADLKMVDFTKPTTLFIDYGNNDMTGGNLIGDLWQSGKEESYWDKSTMLGAINYSLSKLLALYPHIKVIYLTPVWRMLGGSVNPDGGTSGDMVAPYEYTNANGETFMEFVDAIISNTTRLGVKCLDTFRMGGRTALNFDYYSVDSSHFNVKGYEMFANVLSASMKTL